MKNILALGMLLSIGFAATAANAVTPIAPGTYHCIAGSSRMMLTLGDMTVSGTQYSFKAIGGPATSGSYALTAKGYHFTGDIGAITNSQIVEAGPQGNPKEFYFTFKARPTSLPTSVSCSP